MAFSVRERTRELAIRLTLGAPTGLMAGRLVAQYARSLGLGIALGAAGAMGGEHVLLGLQLGLGLTSFDPGGYLLVLVLGHDHRSRSRSGRANLVAWSLREA